MSMSPLVDICTNSQRETLGGSVSRFKLQKHDSSFKHELLMSLIGCGVVQSCIVFSEDSEKPAEISLTCHKPAPIILQRSDGAFLYTSMHSGLSDTNLCQVLQNGLIVQLAQAATWKDIVQTVGELQIRAVQDAER